LVALSIATLWKQHQVAAHSWHVCNDYATAPTSTSINTNFVSASCKGWARSYSIAAAIVPTNLFSGDSGYPVQPSTNNPPCKVTRTTGTDLSTYYSSRFPMANYTIGQTYMVLWPAKNHGAGDNIPDTAMQLYAVCDSTSDPANVAAYKTSSNLVIDWKANGGTGFKNCPAAAVSSDGAQCFQNFTVSDAYFSKYAGKNCTFIWHWEFNSATDIYTSCFDATILSASSAATTTSSTGILMNSNGTAAGVSIGVVAVLFGCTAGFVYVSKKKPEMLDRFRRPGATKTTNVESTKL